MMAAAVDVVIIDTDPMNRTRLPVGVEGGYRVVAYILAVDIAEQHRRLPGRRQRDGVALRAQASSGPAHGPPDMSIGPIAAVESCAPVTRPTKKNEPRDFAVRSAKPPSCEPAALVQAPGGWPWPA